LEPAVGKKLQQFSGLPAANQSEEPVQQRCHFYWTAVPCTISLMKPAEQVRLTAAVKSAG
jgi:hypothetical protein